MKFKKKIDACMNRTVFSESVYSDMVHITRGLVCIYMFRRATRNQSPVAETYRFL